MEKKKKPRGSIQFKQPGRKLHVDANLIHKGLIICFQVFSTILSENLFSETQVAAPSSSI